MNALSPAPRPAFAPGVYRDLPMETYRAADALSCSTLKRFAEAPAKALFPRKETKALAKGTLVHTAVLEPHLLEAEWFVTDLKVINDDHKATQEEKTRAGGRRLVKRKEWEDALRMRDAVHSHPDAAPLLAPGLVTELSFFWADPETGLACKGRADGWRPEPQWNVIVDIKTTTNADARPYGRDAGDLKYHWSAFQYLRGFEAVTGEVPNAFVFIAVEKDEPFLLRCYEPQPHQLEAAERQVRAAMREYAECKAAGRWPGYPLGLAPLEIPDWALA